MNGPRFEIRFKARGGVKVRFRDSQRAADELVAYLARHGCKAKVKELQRL